MVHFCHSRSMISRRQPTSLFSMGAMKFSFLQNDQVDKQKLLTCAPPSCVASPEHRLRARQYCVRARFFQMVHVSCFIGQYTNHDTWAFANSLWNWFSRLFFLFLSLICLLLRRYFSPQKLDWIGKWGRRLCSIELAQMMVYAHVDVNVTGEQ